MAPTRRSRSRLPWRTRSPVGLSWRRTVVAGVAELAVIVLLMWLMPASVFAAPDPTTDYGPPLTPPVLVVRAYDPPAQRWLPGHRGVDLAATPGVAVLAAGAGTVRFAGVVGGKPSVSVAHLSGIITTYEPVRASVKWGASVRKGEVLGTVEAGHPGCPRSACLHWGARRGVGRTADYLNPLALLGAVPVRLKPVESGGA